MIKIESEDQKIEYQQKMAIIKGCGFFFTFPVPSDQVLCAMKISALLSRQKGRDFYDTMFLMGQNPAYCSHRILSKETQNQVLYYCLMNLLKDCEAALFSDRYRFAITA
ncbi:MAG: nucleotidyl transferase AbiEii/AbiGii toxin family protein [Bacteroidales bacterium]|nr:nucleotidyl transferase AbiEii/AbiGii toxin family protein [Bacteroidales bacterium]